MLEFSSLSSKITHDPHQSDLGSGERLGSLDSVEIIFTRRISTSLEASERASEHSGVRDKAGAE